MTALASARTPAPAVAPSELWAIVQTNYHGETLTKAHLVRQRFEVYLPMRALDKRPTGRDATPLFPRYLFVRIDPSAPRWHSIRTTPGVVSMVRGSHGRPGFAPTGLVPAIRAREEFGLVQLNDREAPEPTPAAASGKRAAAERASAFAPGQAVKVTGEGPFTKFDALFNRVIDAKRVEVLLTLFGRETVVELSRDDVAASGVDASREAPEP